MRPSISALVDIERTDNDEDGWDWNRHVLYSVKLVTIDSVAQISQREVTNDDSTTVPVTRMSKSKTHLCCDLNKRPAPAAPGMAPSNLNALSPGLSPSDPDCLEATTPSRDRLEAVVIRRES